MSEQRTKEKKLRNILKKLKIPEPKSESDEIVAVGIRWNGIATGTTILLIVTTLIFLSLTRQQVQMTREQVQMARHQFEMSEIRFIHFLNSIKPRLQYKIDASIDPENEKNNRFSVEVINVARCDARNIRVYFLARLQKRKDFDELTSVDVGDLRRDFSAYKIADEQINEEINKKLKALEKDVFRKKLVVGIRVYATYEDEVGEPHNDLQLERYAEKAMDYK